MYNLKKKYIFEDFFVLFGEEKEIKKEIGW